MNAQVPIDVAASVCGVSVSALAASIANGQAGCTATTTTPQLTQAIQQQIASGGAVTGGPADDGRNHHQQHDVSRPAWSSDLGEGPASGEAGDAAHHKLCRECAAAGECRRTAKLRSGSTRAASVRSDRSSIREDRHARAVGPNNITDAQCDGCARTRENGGQRRKAWRSGWRNLLGCQSCGCLSILSSPHSPMYQLAYTTVSYQSPNSSVRPIAAIAAAFDPQEVVLKRHTARKLR